MKRLRGLSTAFCMVVLSLLSGISWSVDWNDYSSVLDYLSQTAPVKKLILEPESQSAPRRISYVLERFPSGVTPCAISESEADTFIAGNANLLGISGSESISIKTIELLDSAGSQEVRQKLTYGAAINGFELDRWLISISINGNCEIAHVSAVTYTPSATLIDKANNGSFISESQALGIVKNKGSVTYLTDKPFESQLVLINKPPYVIWKILGPSEYYVDAESGAVVFNRPRLVE